METLENQKQSSDWGNKALKGLEPKLICLPTNQFVAVGKHLQLQTFGFLGSQ